MNSIRKAAKIISRRSSVTSTPDVGPLSRTTGVIQTLNTDGTATVQIDGSGVNQPAVCLNGQQLVVGDVVVVLTHGTQTYILGTIASATPGGRPYAIAVSTSPGTIANTATQRIPMGTLTSGYGSWSLDASGRLVIPQSGIYLFTAYAAGYNPTVGFGSNLLIQRNGASIGLGDSVIGASIAGLSEASQGDKFQLMLDNVTGASISPTASDTQMHAHYVGPI